MRLRCELSATITYTYLPRALVRDDPGSTVEPGHGVTIPVIKNDDGQGGSIDPTSVTIAGTPKLGTVVVNADGTVTYTPNPGVTTGTDTFTYNACDDATQIATCSTSPATATVVIQPQADLSIAKTGPPSETRGSQATYTLKIGNNGPDASTPVVTDVLPAGLSFASGSGTGFIACTASGQTVTCNGSAPLPAGASQTITLVVAVAGNAPDSISNTATVNPGDTAVDRTSANNSSTTGAAAVQTQVDLGIGVTASTLTSGGTGTYTVTATNHGPSPTTTTTTVTDTLPSGVTVDTTKTLGGPGYSSCAVATNGSGQQLVTCGHPASLANGETAQLSIPVTVAATANGPVVDTATVATGDTEPQPDTANPDTTSLSSPLIYAFDLTVAKVHQRSSFLPGGSGAYDVTISNGGPSTTGTATVTLSDPLPAGLTATGFDTSGAPGFACSGITTITCVSTTSLPAKATATVKVTVSVPTADAGTSVTNTATVASNPADSDTTNNTGSDTVAVPVTALSVTKCVAAGTGAACDTSNPVLVRGKTVTYLISPTYSSTPAVTSPGLTVTDTLPDGLVPSTATGHDGWACSASGQTVTCTATGLASGTTTQITVVALVAQTAPATVTNTATIAPSVAGSVFQSDTSKTTSPPVTSPVSSTTAFTIMKSSDQAFTVGQPGSYTITVTNNGPSSAGQVTVTDPLPTGITYLAANSGWMCTGATSVTCTSTAGLAVGQSATLTLTVAVATEAYTATAAHTVTNTASAGGSSSNPVTTLVTAASIGDYVFADANGNGLQDPGETGVAGEQVQLLDARGTPTAVVTTDGSGHYLFDGLAPGDYTVAFTQPASGMAFTRPMAGGTPDTAIDSDPAVATGRTPVVPLTAGTPDTSIDAGIITLGSLAGEVYGDNDASGTLNAGDTGIAGVTVTVTGTDDLGAAVSAATTSAAASTAPGSPAVGTYSFPWLRPGTYTVTVTQATVPASYHPGSTTAPAGTPGTATLTGLTLTPGQTVAPVAFGELTTPTPTPPTATPPAATTAIPPTSAATAALGDTVFLDIHGDGIQHADDPGVPGVTVTLYDSTGARVGTTATGPTGTYLFTRLAASTYIVGFTHLPAGTAFTQQGAGTDRARDSNADPATGRTKPVTLTTGHTDRDIDAGVVRLGGVTGTVYTDTNANGRQDPGEPGTRRVTITVTGTDDLGRPVTRSTVTGPTGAWTVPGLRPGTYTVVAAGTQTPIRVLPEAHTRSLHLGLIPPVGATRPEESTTTAPTTPDTPGVLNTTSRRVLAFTGVNALPLFEMGLGLVAAGALILAGPGARRPARRRRLSQTDDHVTSGLTGAVSGRICGLSQPRRDQHARPLRDNRRDPLNHVDVATVPGIKVSLETLRRWYALSCQLLSRSRPWSARAVVGTRAVTRMAATGGNRSWCDRIGPLGQDDGDPLDHALEAAVYVDVAAEPSA